MIIDAGVLRFAAPSTIVKIDNDTLTVLRQGEVFVKTKNRPDVNLFVNDLKVEKP